MKRLWVALSLIVFALTMGIVELCIVSNSYTKYSKQLETAEYYFSNREFSEAYDICTHTLNQWENDEKTLNLFLLHSRVDKISEDMAQLCEFAKSKDNEMFSSTCVKTKRQLLHLKMSELPLIENII